MKNTASIQENNAMELRPRGMYGSAVNGVERGFVSRPRRTGAKTQTRAKVHPGEAGVVSGRRVRIEMPALGKVFTLQGILLMLASILAVSTAVILMLFNFETATIYGNTKYSREQIESFITRGTLGENTFVMALKYHHRKVFDIPFVDQIDIDIVNPSTVRVNITEKPTDGCIFYKGNNVYFSRDGIIQTVSGRTVDETTIINGVVLTHSKMGAQILAKNQLGLDLSLELMRAAYKYGIHADSIDVDSRNNLTVSFGDVMVKVGKTGYDQKMFRLHQIYPYLEGRSGVISMTGYKDTYDSGYNIVLSPFVTEAELRAAEEAEAQKAEAERAEAGKAEAEKAEAEKAEAEKAETEKSEAEKAEAEKAEAGTVSAEPTETAAPAQGQDAAANASDGAADAAADAAAPTAAQPDAEAQTTETAQDQGAEPARSDAAQQPAAAAQDEGASPDQAQETEVSRTETNQTEADQTQIEGTSAPSASEAEAAAAPAEGTQQ